MFLILQSESCYKSCFQLYFSFVKKSTAAVARDCLQWDSFDYSATHFLPTTHLLYFSGEMVGNVVVIFVK